MTSAGLQGPFLVQAFQVHVYCSINFVNIYFQCRPEEVGRELPQGLILGHGYNITKVAEINVDKKHQGAIGASKLFMVRMANPWGVKEWNGPWSDG